MMRLFQVIFSILWGLGYLGNGILFLYVEWTFLRQSFIQLFNPLLHLQVLGVLIATPLFWMFLAMAVVGYYATSSIERHLEQSATRDEINPKRAIPPFPQTFQERQPSPSFSSVQSEQPNSHISPRPIPKPSSRLESESVEPYIDVQTRVNPEAQSLPSNIALENDTSSQVKQRPYIEYRVHEIEKIVDLEWNSIEILNAIYYELEFRSRKKALDLRERIAARLIQLQDKQFSWSTTANPGSQNLPSDTFNYEEGLLRYYGYNVGINGLPESKRWEILDKVFLYPLLPMDNDAYLSEWGEPMSAKRLRKLVESIAAFTRNAKRRKKGSFTKAIQDWETDLAYLKRTYYKNRCSFQYPRT
jgi:hypothetical protein